MSWLFARETMIAFAVLGGIASVLGMVLQKRDGGPSDRVTQLNRLSYIFMAISVVLFIVAGVRGPRE